MAPAAARPGPAAPKLAILELGRFIAALTVVLTHLLPDTGKNAAPGAAPLFGGWHAPGAIGVQYFFVLSGFVMMTAHLKDWGQPLAPFRFWWRRACRIYPTYWLALLIPIYYLHGFLTPSFSLQLFSLAPWRGQDFISTAWTLRYEMAFYLAFGFCLIPRLGKFILALWVLCAIWRWLPGPALQFLHLAAPFALNKALAGWGGRFADFLDYYFFAGLAAGFVFSKHPPKQTASLILIVAGTILLLFSLPRMDWGYAFGSPMFALRGAALLGAILLGLAGLERSGRLHIGRFAGFCGALSYPLYILHAPLLLLLDQTMPRLALGTPALYALFLVELAALLAISALVTVAFDRPVQRALRLCGQRAGQAWNAATSRISPQPTLTASPPQSETPHSPPAP